MIDFFDEGAVPAEEALAVAVRDQHRNVRMEAR
jgi:hypothetical protein